jgi:hypothetical protein
MRRASLVDFRESRSRLHAFENDRQRNGLAIHCVLNRTDESKDIQRLGLNLDRWRCGVYVIGCGSNPTSRDATQGSNLQPLRVK